MAQAFSHVCVFCVLYVSTWDKKYGRFPTEGTYSRFFDSDADWHGPVCVDSACPLHTFIPQTNKMWVRLTGNS